MSVNLTKNNDSLVDAWHRVVDDKSPVNWAVFGYEGQTNNLKVVGTGSGGLEEMIDELNSGSIMYAFCRVIDTKTSLPKCVLVNWQGECAPIVRKGTCANHIRDIEKLLKGAHITVNARSEEDVEVELIMEKLARATGSSYKFNEPRGENGGNSGPVGTTYRRVIPEQEINASERDRFWQREEIEEKQRVEQERLRLEKDRRRLELETRSREEQASKLREQQQVSTSEVSGMVEKKSEQRAAEIKNLRNQQMMAHQNSSDTDDEHKSRSEELRRQRSNEAQQLIAQRTINARAVFEQNTSAGQMRQNLQPVHHQKFVTRNNPVRNVGSVSEMFQEKEANVQERGERKAQERETKVEERNVTTTEESKQAAEVKVETATKASDERAAATVEQFESVEKATISKMEELAIGTNNGPPTVIGETTEESLNNVETELYNQLSGGEPYLYFDPNNEGMKARALYDYQAADDTEITFDPGDIITHIDAIDEGWWQGLGPDGTYGLFPANYVEVIENDAT
ncbi:drebrin-like protein [Venturia canescens]|uniref:drebrin-like protein n=1 Tax=Venturia canescens TaxID=32260 RepID=UPI001C9C54F6|nr:drebrin-like protein [Venturia canescens]